ncbi:hypothetical protein T484DRAFT_1921141 [Baffinella frigidus]|nr:hypothetical protein T484DRAFT_1921141 [Cryptophyta sp. CCMP2293]|mmetsp:Transcript_33768/g.78862  ORF Transcript_33768/g.78862 Transcript_33768/m.78862 type:complete len:151 (+) Transcript_33768:44-496(+)
MQQSPSTPVSPHRADAARLPRRCSNDSWTDVTAFTDMDPGGFSLADLAFEMEEECASSDDESPSRRRASDSPPPLPLPLLAAPRSFVSEKKKPAPAAPRASSESPADVTDEGWLNFGAGSTPGMYCSETVELEQARPTLHWGSPARDWAA